MEKIAEKFFIDYHKYIQSLGTYDNSIIEPLLDQTKRSLSKMKEINFDYDKNKLNMLNTIKLLLKESLNIDKLQIDIRDILTHGDYYVNQKYIKDLVLNELEAEKSFLMSLMHEYKFEKIYKAFNYSGNECFYDFVIKNINLLSDTDYQEIALIRNKSCIAKKIVENNLAEKNNLSFEDNVRNFTSSISFYENGKDELSGFFRRLSYYNYSITPEMFFSQKNKENETVFDKIFKKNPEKIADLFMKNKSILKKINLENIVMYLLTKKDITDSEVKFLSYSLSMKIGDSFAFLNKDGNNFLLEKMVKIKSSEHMLLRKIQRQSSNLYSELSMTNKLNLIKKNPENKDLILSLTNNIGAVLYSSIVLDNFSDYEKKELIDNYKNSKIFIELKKDLEKMSDYLKTKIILNNVSVKSVSEKRKIRI